MKTFLRIFLYLSVCGLASGSILNAATITSNPVTAAWTSVTTWVGGVVPGAGDDVVIVSGAVITLSTSTTVVSTTINSGGRLNIGANLSLSGDIIANGMLSGSGYVITTNGNITISGPNASLVFNGSAGWIVGTAAKTFTLANGALFELAVTGATPLATILKVSGAGAWTWVVDNSISNTTITYKNGSSTTVITALPNGQSYGNVGIKSASAGTSDWSNSLGASLTINGNFIFTNTTSAKQTLDLLGNTLTGNGTTSTFIISNTSTGSVGIQTSRSITDFSLLFPGFMPVTGSTFGTFSFNASADQIIPGATYNNLIISGTGGTKTFNGDVTVNGTFTRGGATTIPVLNFASYSLTYGPGATLEYSYSGADQTSVGPEWPATNGPTNLKINSSRFLTLDANRTITGFVNRTLASSSVTGAFIKVGSAGTLNYASGAYLIYNTNGSVVPKFNVTDYSNCKDIRINAIGSSNYVSTGGNQTFGSDVVITLMGNSGLKVDLGATGAGPVTLTINGTLITGATNTIIEGSFSQGADAFVLGATGTIKTANPSGLNGVIATTGANSLSTLATYEFNGTAAQVTGTLLPAAVGQLLLNNTAGITITNPVTVSGSLTLGGNGTYTNLTNVSGYSGIAYAATNPQTTGDELASSIGALTINNSNGVFINSSKTVTSALNLLNGKLFLGEHNLILGKDAVISGTPSVNGMVVAEGAGSFIKLIDDTQNTPYSITFPVGDNTGIAEYSPVTITINSGSFSAAQLSVNLTNAKHPANSSIADYVNRYWTISSTGISNPNYTVVCNYLPGDITGTESNLVGGKRTASVWSNIGGVNSVTHSITGSSLTSLGDFTAGEATAFSGPTSGIVSITAIPEGYYNPSSSAVLSIEDTLQVYLASTVSPYMPVDSANVVIDRTTYTGSAKFTHAANGTYYLLIKGRAIVKTWSAAGIPFVQGSTSSYDFTSAASQAYNNNQVLKGTKWCIYSGDVDQSGYIDNNDLLLIDNAAFAFMSGYLITDLDGSLYVDNNDLLICDNNAFGFIGTKGPDVMKKQLRIPITVKTNQKKDSQVLPEGN